MARMLILSILLYHSLLSAGQVFDFPPGGFSCDTADLTSQVNACGNTTLTALAACSRDPAETNIQGCCPYDAAAESCLRPCGDGTQADLIANSLVLWINSFCNGTFIGGSASCSGSPSSCTGTIGVVTATAFTSGVPTATFPYVPVSERTTSTTSQATPTVSGAKGNASNGGSTGPSQTSTGTPQQTSSSSSAVNGVNLLMTMCSIASIFL